MLLSCGAQIHPYLPGISRTVKHHRCHPVLIAHEMLEKEVSGISRRCLVLTSTPRQKLLLLQPCAYLICIIKQKKREEKIDCCRGRRMRNWAMLSSTEEWGAGLLPSDGSKSCLWWIAGECWRSSSFTLMKYIPELFCWFQQEQHMGRGIFFIRTRNSGTERSNPMLTFWMKYTDKYRRFCVLKDVRRSGFILCS